jgi:adenosylcobinamide kinase / adenosylcobinamide-phosphate guanylyltransferase
MALVLLTGGARSGKSRLAIELARRQGRPVVVVATAEGLDDEMAIRIRRHRDERPVEWTTVEEPIELESAITGAPVQAFVVVDCLSLWAANLMGRELPEEQIVSKARSSAAAAASRPAGTVAVTNEVGSGVVPDNVLGRRYRDVLGLVNASWASAATRVGLVVADRLLPLSKAEDVWSKDEGWMTN